MPEELRSLLLDARQRALDFLLPDGSPDPTGFVSGEETELAQLVVSLVDVAEELATQVERAREYARGLGGWFDDEQ